MRKSLLHFGIVLLDIQFKLGVKLFSAGNIRKKRTFFFSNNASAQPTDILGTTQNWRKTYYSLVRAFEVEIEDSLKAGQARDEAREMHLLVVVV